MEKEIKPRLNAVFNNEGLKIVIEPASQVTDYLDTKLNLERHTHEPYRKLNDNPLYLNVQSNHPRHIIKHILNRNLTSRCIWPNECSATL